MRIVGKGSDYYDSCLGHGFDPNLVYVRKPVTSEKGYDHPLYNRIMAQKATERENYMMGEYRGPLYESLPSTSRTVELKRGRREVTVEPGFIGFCGKVYPFFVVSTTKENYGGFNDKTERTFHYDTESLLDRCKELGVDIQESGSTRRWYYRSSKLTRRTIDDFLIPFEDDTLFHDIGNPCFALYCHENTGRQDFTMLENPILKEFQFYRVFDAYTAFQELSMYIGGVLGAAHPPMIDISDEEMAKKKGFGHKYAFRKEPGKKRRNK